MPHFFITFLVRVYGSFLYIRVYTTRTYNAAMDEARLNLFK